MKRLCVICRSSFTPPSPWAWVCSEDCQTEANERADQRKKETEVEEDEAKTDDLPITDAESAREWVRQNVVNGAIRDPRIPDRMPVVQALADMEEDHDNQLIIIAKLCDAVVGLEDEDRLPVVQLCLELNARLFQSMQYSLKQ